LLLNLINFLLDLLKLRSLLRNLNLMLEGLEVTNVSFLLFFQQPLCKTNPSKPAMLTVR